MAARKDHHCHHSCGKERSMKRKVLVIEDNEQNLYLVKFILEKHGYEVCEARDGREGIEMAVTVKPDLILLDIQLPVMDGYAVAKILRTQLGLAQVPIIAVTSYAMAGDREKTMEAGCTGYIEKPINPDTFMGQVEQNLPPPGA
jgi:CheY-like chemotaxis protein